MDIVRFKAVCCSWNIAAQSYIASPFYIPPCCSPPLLMLNGQKDCDDHPGSALQFFSVTENRYYKMKNSIFEEIQGYYRCLASSQGWLMVSGRNSDSFCLLNPFSGVKFQLPYHRRLIRSGACQQIALILFDQCSPSKSFCIAALCFPRPVFYMHGDVRWTEFGEKHRKYCRITCHNGLVYALTYTDTLEAWNFRNDFPEKVSDLNVSGTVKLRCFGTYLMESMGELLLVSRIRGGPGFAVYKMDFGRKRWVLVENLGDRALFLSEQECVSISSRNFSEVGENLIYYTGYDGIDWDGIFRVYNYKEKKLVVNIDEIRISLDFGEFPFWVVPNPF
ncbi:hypothetical protein FNV43_RR02141 [Rhamnella rubrinervis]|uniref:KIB1-4 beta-propeller domain-containing protein n=1 Tax=Rhamnella rubrinervis TaxID=2594499 RepID=A0A8K0HTC8_9ROSA|nr:hypothetical protein FNV43_RR02141 [Rhamnella rubrinervis]